MAFRAPVLGYNTNVRHKGRLFHIQTEDSGVGHPHVISHLFADGGRIVASKKTAYADQLGAENLPDLVKKLMQAQHKAMFIALRDGLYDEDPVDSAVTRPHVAPPPADITGLRDRPSETRAELASDVPTSGPLYRETLSVQGGSAKSTSPEPALRVSLFGGDGAGESLDEVILHYLAQQDREHA